AADRSSHPQRTARGNLVRRRPLHPSDGGSAEAARDPVGAKAAHPGVPGVLGRGVSSLFPRILRPCHEPLILRWGQAKLLPESAPQSAQAAESDGFAYIL